MQAPDDEQVDPVDPVAEHPQPENNHTKNKMKRSEKEKIIRQSRSHCLTLLKQEDPER